MSMLQSELSDYSDACIVIKGTITATDPNNDVHDKKLTFKNNAPFISCISKINNTLIDNAEDLVSLCTIWLSTTKILQKQQEVYGTIIEMNLIVVQKESKLCIWGSKSFDYKTKITGRLEERIQKKSWNCCSVKTFK